MLGRKPAKTTLLPAIAGAALFMLLAAPLAQASEAQAYVCLEQKRTGISNTPQGLEVGSFKPVSFTMVKTGDEVVIKTDKTPERYSCSQPFDSNNKYIQCVERFYFLTLNLATGHYVHARMFPPSGDKDDDTVTVARGICQKM